MALLPHLRDLLHGAKDPLVTAVRIAIAGNIIDYGAAESFALEATLERVLEAPFVVDALDWLRQSLAVANSVLYLADNAGETVFDRVLIEQLAVPATYVVKAKPVIDDATREDALTVGVDEVAEIIDNGSGAPGTLLWRCFEAFSERFEQASLIIAKGQANYETLSTTPAPTCFLLQAKCPVIADDLGVDQGGIVVKAADTHT
ncbi:MAG: damage-control phosphatase ARMT1 family protein [Anaerolineae bacterium]